MHMMLPSLLSLFLTALGLISPPRQQGIVGYFNPTVLGGSWLDNAGDGFGEPLNVGMVDCNRKNGPDRFSLYRWWSQA